MEKAKTQTHLVYRRNNLIVTGIIMAVCLVFFAGSFFLGKTAGRMPRVVSVLGMGMTAIEFVMQIKNLKKTEADKDEKFTEIGGIPWYYIFAAMIVYVLLMYWFGFIVSNFIFLFATPFIIGMREGHGFSKWKGYLLYSIVTTAILYLAFSRVFVIRLPQGILLRMIMGR